MKALAVAILAFALFASCYDAKSPNLPPCDRGAEWPDPCTGMPADAGTG